MNIQSSDTLAALGTKLHFHENRNSLIACGELLNYLQNRETVYIESLETFTLKNYMYLSNETIWELAIFNQSSHPNSHCQKKVENKSLFRLIN